MHLWQVYRTPYKMLGGGPECSLYKSRWRKIMGGYFRKSWICKKTSGKIGITVSGANSNKLWALVESNEGGVYVSENAGKSWKNK